MKVVAKYTVKMRAMDEEDQDDWMREEMEKEERLSRMEIKRKEWETGYICKDIVEDILKVITEHGMEDTIEIMDGIGKLDMVIEVKQKYIDMDVNMMTELVLNDTISKTQESREPEEEIPLEPLTGQVGGMRVMVSLEGCDARLQEGGEGPEGDNGGGDVEQVGTERYLKKFENININKLISDWDRRECSGLLGDELGPTYCLTSGSPVVRSLVYQPSGLGFDSWHVSF